MGKRVKIGENEKIIIRLIGAGVLVAASLALPNLPMALKPILKMRGNKGLQKMIHKLKNKNIINLGSERIKLTSKGKQLLNEIYISEIKITQQEEWDHVWRLVAYDIPEKYKKLRDMFRKVLERNNFYPIQESLWINPYECKEEIAVLAKKINVYPYVIFLTTDHLPNQQDMVDHFHLIG